jgi:ubiquitin-conjugating enzyme E2 Q
VFFITTYSRYLLVKSTADPNPSATAASDDTTESNPNGRKKKGKKKSVLTPYVKLDPQHMTQMASKVIEIPDPAFQVDFLLSARKDDYVYEEPDEDDLAIFQFGSKQGSTSSQCHGSEYDYYGGDGTEDHNLHVASPTTKKPSKALQRPKNDWKHAAEYVKKTLENLMIPPFQSSTSASLAIQRELRAMVKEQDAAPSLRDLGWYMPPDLIGDNLYQWIVEMHSFDLSLPIAKDMKAK